MLWQFSFLYVLLLFHCVEGGIRHFENEQLRDHEPFGFRAGLYSVEETPAIESRHSRNPESFFEIRVAARFSQVEEFFGDALDVMIIHARDFEEGRIGYSGPETLGLLEVCCTHSLYERLKWSRGAESLPRGCSSPSDLGTLMVNVEDESELIGQRWKFGPNSNGRGSLTVRLNAEEGGSGIYYGYIVDCLNLTKEEAKFSRLDMEVDVSSESSPSLSPSSSSSSPSSLLQVSGRALVSGHMRWINPFGHLSADVYPLLPFFGVMTCCYIAMGLVWLALSARHWSQLLPTQNLLAGVMAIGMIECVVWYFDFHSENVGSYNLVLTSVALFSSTSKKAISRLFFLVVSMGYGVHKPTLGEEGYRAVLFSAIYWIASSVFSISDHIHKRFHYAEAKAVADLFVFPVAMLDTAFYWWTFMSLSLTMTQLHLRNQTLKLAMYRRFFKTLVIAAGLSGLVVLYELWAMLISSVDDRWQTWWMWEAFWHILFFVLLAIFAVIWQPTDNNTRYALHSAEDVPKRAVSRRTRRKMNRRNKKGSSSTTSPSSCAPSASGTNHHASHQDTTLEIPLYNEAGPDGADVESDLVLQWALEIPSDQAFQEVTKLE